MDFTKKDSLALKGIAILMMYVHHFYLSPERWAGYTVDFFPLTESMTVYLAEFLKTCVCVFVFITGYGMTQSLKQKHPDFRPSSTDMLSYTRHRLVSLLSNFIFVYLLVILWSSSSAFQRAAFLRSTVAPAPPSSMCWWICSDWQNCLKRRLMWAPGGT